LSGFDVVTLVAAAYDFNSVAVCGGWIGAVCKDGKCLEWYSVEGRAFGWMFVVVEIIFLCCPFLLLC